MALSLAQQYYPDLSNFTDPLRMLQSFDTYSPTDQMEFTVTALDEVGYVTDNPPPLPFSTMSE